MNTISLLAAACAGYAIGIAIAAWADAHEAPRAAAAGVLLGACCLVGAVIAGALS